MIWIGHKREDETTQILEAHLKETAEISEEFCKKFQAGKWGFYLGRTHDIGKAQLDFWKRIMENAPIHVDHSTPGAVLACREVRGLGLLLAYCIAGHHGGLPDGGTDADSKDSAALMGRLKREFCPGAAWIKDRELREFRMEEKLPFSPFRYVSRGGGFSVSFFIRMLYSALVDADWLNTEAFMKDGAVDRKIPYDFETFYQLLEKKLRSFDSQEKEENPRRQEINRKRNEIFQQCIAAALGERGLYSLTVPTGGGKTLASLGFAIRHAIEWGMDRIIYVIPYCSILEQNAGVAEEVLGKEFVLQHHSNFVFSPRPGKEEEEDEALQKKKRASENWDIPIVFTTNVQFFESLFSHKPSSSRKVHNMANSVIIFDEAQMLPLPYIKPCMAAIAELSAHYNSTCVLCTATQPVFERFLPKGVKAKEICKDTADLYEFFQRVQVKKRGLMRVEELAEEMNQLEQCLCIVDNKRQAKAIYNQLKDGFYLTTWMCPKHRKKVIQDIKYLLRKGKPCRVAATRLIEAGVDVDFPVVYRSMAGIDSIIQACGRCNREGKLPGMGQVFVFEPEDCYLRVMPKSLRRPAEAAREVIDKYEDLVCPEAVAEYFNNLYGVEGAQGLDTKGILERLEYGIEEGLSFPFRTIGEEFCLIEEQTYPVIVPFDEEAKKLIASIPYTKNLKSVLRKLQPYTVTIYENELRKLNGAQGPRYITPVEEGIYVLDDMRIYDEKTGLTIENSSGIGLFI